MADGMSTLEYEKATGWVNQSVTQLDFYTFFRKLLKQISFLYFPDRGCDPNRSIKKCLLKCLKLRYHYIQTFRLSNFYPKWFHSIIISQYHETIFFLNIKSIQIKELALFQIYRCPYRSCIWFIIQIHCTGNFCINSA